MFRATVATTSSRALLAACQQLGLASDDLLSTAGLTAAQVEDPDGRLPVEAVSALWHAALVQSRDPGLGLRIAMAVPFGAYRVIDFLAASAPTVGDGLTRVARYFPIINSALSWEIVDEAGSKRLSIVHPGIPGELPRPYAEYALAVTILHCRHASGFDWPLEEVCFAFAAPPSAEAHARAFGCPVRFGQPRNAFVIAQATWDLPSLTPSSDLLRTLEAHASTLLSSLDVVRETTGQVARAIVDELEGGDPSLVTVARKMALSPRTLQRRLAIEGTSFAEVLDTTRRHVAEAYIKDRALALSEVSYLLGFSEPSAFTRAFQRWFGVAPRQFRMNQGSV